MGWIHSNVFVLSDWSNITIETFTWRFEHDNTSSSEVVKKTKWISWKLFGLLPRVSIYYLVHFHRGSYFSFLITSCVSLEKFPHLYNEDNQYLLRMPSALSTYLWIRVLSKVNNSFYVFIPCSCYTYLRLYKVGSSKCLKQQFKLCIFLFNRVTHLL